MMAANKVAHCSCGWHQDRARTQEHAAERKRRSCAERVELVAMKVVQ